MSDEEQISPTKTPEETQQEHDTRDLTDQEKNSLPFDFKKPYAYKDSSTVYAEWHKKPVYSRNLQDWYLDEQTEHYEDDIPISAHYWEIYYPGYKHLSALDIHTLKGRFNERSVRWSRSQSAWVYNNNRQVTFPQATTSDDEKQVDTLLESAS